MLKRTLSIFLTVGLIFFTGCNSEVIVKTNDETSIPSNSAGVTITRDMIDNFGGYSTHANLLMDSMKEEFWMTWEDKMSETPGSTTPVTLWGYAAYMEAAGLRLEADPTDEAAKTEYLKALNSVEKYRAVWRTDDLQVYQCWADVTQAECFYDDDIWLVIEFLNAYELLSDSHWLEQAKGTAEFCYSGWDDKQGGGVYWREDDKASKNTCSNAPLAWASALLYKATNEQKYLDWAEKIYDWTKTTLLDTSDYLYFDNINLEGNVDKAKYTYNVGNMIGAGAELYGITNKAEYLEDAKKSAEGAYKVFGTAKPVPNMTEEIYVCESNSWFGGSLLKGYMALGIADTETDAKYVNSYRECLAYASIITVDPRGYMSVGWITSEMITKPSLLDQSGNARLLYLCAE